MIMLNQIFFDVISIWGDKRPEYQKTSSTYVGNDKQYVKIIEIIYEDGRPEVLLWTAINDGQSYEGQSFDTLQRRLDIWGWVLGDYLDDDRIELTERGECEAALLSSIPYLFHENQNGVLL